MNKIDDFETILNNTILPSNMPLSEQEKKCQNLYDFVQGRMPETLFRYRRCNERSFDAFDRDCVWVSRADSMNDGFDSRLFFDKKEIISWREYILSDDYIQETRRFLTGQNIPGSALVFPGIKDLLQTVRETTEYEFQQITEHYRELIRTDIDKLIVTIGGIIQQTLKFCCLSEVISSAAMWGHYSDNETGFALAYDCRHLDKTVINNPNHPRTCTCFPVVYGDTRYQVPTDYIKFMMQYSLLNKSMINYGYSALYPQPANAILMTLPCPDTFVSTKIALHKSSEWAYEKEWRLFCSGMQDPMFTEATHGYFVMRPTAIYLGRRISSINEKILISLAKEKDLPIYKMALDDEAFSYDLIAERVK